MCLLFTVLKLKKEKEAGNEFFINLSLHFVLQIKTFTIITRYTKIVLAVGFEPNYKRRLRYHCATFAGQWYLLYVPSR